VLANHPPRYDDGRLKLIHYHKLDHDLALSLNKKNAASKNSVTIEGNQVGEDHHSFIVGDKFENWWANGETKTIKIYPNIKNSGLF